MGQLMAQVVRSIHIITSRMIHRFDWLIPLGLSDHSTVDHEEDKCRYTNY